MQSASSPTHGTGAIGRRGLLGLLGALLLIPPLAAAKWPAVEPGDLAASSSKIDPDAGAEIIFSEAVIEQRSYHDMSSRHHVRIKLFNQRGVEENTKIEIPYDRDTSIDDIAARTIKPDGTVTELSEKDIYDREIAKAGNERIKVKAFALPAVEPGAIIEYRYARDSKAFQITVPLVFTGRLPSRLTRFKFQPMQLAAADIYMRSLFFNWPAGASGLGQDKSSYYTIELANLPATKPEPFQPPAFNTEPSVMLYYAWKTNPEPAVYWKEQGRALQRLFDSSTKPSKAIRTALAAAVNDNDPPETKLQKIYDYCRTHLRNRWRKSSGFTPKQLTEMARNETSADTLKSGGGTGEEINQVFAALVREAGLEARYARCNRRSTILFDLRTTELFMTPDLVVAVRLGGNWRYFDPGSIYLPAGRLTWWNTDTAVLLADEENARPAPLDGDPADLSVRRRTGAFRLETDGTLEGDVTVEYSGHEDVALKLAFDPLDASERETRITEEIQSTLKQAEVTQLKIENALDPLAAIRVTFHLRVPQYADSTSTRLLFQPAVFEKGARPVFDTPERRTNIVFPYRHTDQDEFTFALPPGFELEQATSPGPLALGQLGSYDARVYAEEKIRYTRKSSLGLTFVNRGAYAPLRRVFEDIARRDALELALHRKDSTASSGASARD